MKKFMKKFLVCILSIIIMACGGLVGCSGDDVDDADGTVNVLLLEAGFGTDFMTQWIKEFNSISGNENIKVKFYFDVEATTKATNYLANPSENPYDLFFTGGLGFKQQAELGNLVDLSDVYSEFENPLREEFRDYGKYKDGYYMMPWASGPSGLVYNTDMLTSSKVPKTSSELLNLAKDIKAGNISTAAGVSPFVWAGKNAGDYWQYVTDCWWAQYEGIDAYKNFWSLNNNDPNGYTVYGQDGILKSYEALATILDISKGFSLHGSDTKEHTPAQSDFMQGRAVMIPVGDWLENEMKESYADFTSYKIMKTPVISALGEDLQLAGSSATAAQHDAKLAEMIGYIDSGKPSSEIAALMAISKDKIDIVVDARSLIVNIGANHQAYIPSKSNAIPEAKAFLRFVSTNKANDIFRKYSNATLPFENMIDTSAPRSQYMTSKDDLMSSSYSLLPQYDSSSIRYKAGLFKWNKILDVEKQIYNKTITPQAFVTSNYNYFTTVGENKWDYFYSRR